MTVPAPYAFRSVFVLQAAPRDVFDAVLRPDRWLRDLAHVRALQRLEPSQGQGPRYGTTIAAAAGYRLRFELAVVELRAPELIVWRAAGDLAGHGSWRLAPAGAGTRVTSIADLRTTRRWMNLLAPIARPLFVRNHDLVMRAGVDALAAHLGAAVTRFEPDHLLTSGR